MLSQLKAREVTPAPEESGNQVDKTSKSKISDVEQQAARLTCDALCSLANGIKGSSSSPTPNVATAPVPTLSSPLGVHGFLYRSAAEPVAAPPTPQLAPTDKTVPATNKNATTTAKTSTKITKQHQLPLFLSSKFLVIDSVWLIILYEKRESCCAHSFLLVIQFFSFENVLERTIHQSRAFFCPCVSSRRFSLVR